MRSILWYSEVNCISNLSPNHICMCKQTQFEDAQLLTSILLPLLSAHQSSLLEVMSSVEQERNSHDSPYSVLARNCKPGGGKVSITLCSPCKCTVWLGSIANQSGLYYGYNDQFQGHSHWQSGFNQTTFFLHSCHAQHCHSVPWLDGHPCEVHSHIMDGMCVCR